MGPQGGRPERRKAATLTSVARALELGCDSTPGQWPLGAIYRSVGGAAQDTDVGTRECSTRQGKSLNSSRSWWAD